MGTKDTQSTGRQDQVSIYARFLKDVLLCSLGSYGGPEAHYGVFSSILVKKRRYLDESEFAELIGLFALVPGPSSTQTITAIGYHVGGPLLALLTFLVWALPAILTMGLLGVFFDRLGGDTGWQRLTVYLPAAAVGFIIYAAGTLSRKVLKQPVDVVLFVVMLAAGLLLVRYSMWIVPLLLVLGGMVKMLPRIKERSVGGTAHRPRWLLLGVVVALALVNEGLRLWTDVPGVLLYTTFYRYGYSVIGGGQIVIPLMIQDLVQSQALLSLHDFLSGYAIDQAIPGPLFSFAAFVGSRSFAGTGFSFLAGLTGGLSIFLPGILLVFFMFPLWKSLRGLTHMQRFLAGVSVTAASLIGMTAITQALALPAAPAHYAVTLAVALGLFSRKVPAPLLVALAAVAGFML